MQKRVPGSVRGGRTARAFTLLEVMIVIVIILAILGLVTVNLMGTRKTADTKLVQVQLESLKGALDHFYLEFNRYPTEEEGLSVLWTKEAMADEDQAKWRMFTKEPLPRDPWGTEWGYRIASAEESEDGSGTGFEVWSYGPDKEDGGSDDIHPPGRNRSSEEGSDVGPPPPGGN